MTDVLFYHLERMPLNQVLPGLLEKTLDKGWRAIVQVASEERLEALDSLLWTYKDSSFLAHGTYKDGQDEKHPIFLAKGGGNPNKADVVFFVDGTTREDISSFERAVYLFDGHDDQAVEQARGYYKAAKNSGYQVTYWQQDEQGRWRNKA